MPGWIMLTGVLLFAYGMGYATREIISRMRRRQAEELRRMIPRRGRSDAKL